MKWLLVFVIVCCNAAGDLLNAFGMRQHGHVRDFHPSALRRLVRSLVHNRFVIVGIVALTVAFFALLSLLSIAPLSFSIPATAAGYLVETILARLYLKEEIHWQRWLGACLVAGGVVLLSLP